MEPREPISAEEWRAIAAVDNVTICHMAGRPVGEDLRWVVWDRGLDTDDDLGVVYVGRKVDFDRDTGLDNPPGDVHWAHKQAVARSILRLSRQITKESEGKAA